MPQIVYHDFNNNRYEIDAESFVYIPITPKESSSGHYSGGAGVEKKIESDYFLEVMVAAKALMNEKTLHREKRKMLTAMLTIREGEDVETAILGRSVLQRELDRIVKSMRD